MKSIYRSVTRSYQFSGVKKEKQNFLTTIHTGVMQDSGKRDYTTQGRIMKLDVALDYTQHKRMVEKSESKLAILNSSENPRNGIKNCSSIS